LAVYRNSLGLGRRIIQRTCVTAFCGKHTSGTLEFGTRPDIRQPRRPFSPLPGTDTWPRPGRGHSAHLRGAAGHRYPLRQGRCRRSVITRRDTRPVRARRPLALALAAGSDHTGFATPAVRRVLVCQFELPVAQFVSRLATMRRLTGPAADQNLWVNTRAAGHLLSASQGLMHFLTAACAAAADIIILDP